MSKFNDAELHAIKELDPQGYLRWQLPELDEDLEWYTWLETQVSPPTGLPFLRCDCVAGLHSRSGSQAPWACLIEAQAQPIPRLAVWMLIYLGLLHEDLLHGPYQHDRFQMMGAILNLTEGTLATTVDWAPSLKQSPPPPETQLGVQSPDSNVTGAPPESPASPELQLGVRCRFGVRNVRQEHAGQTLEQIAEGKVALCILVWVALMVGGDETDVLRRWQEQVLRQEQAHLRADYVTLALVFAELAGRGAVWSAALKEFDVQDSRIAQQWEDKGIEKGLLAGKIQAFQEVLKQPITPFQDLSKLPKQELAALLAQLHHQVLPNGS